MKRGQQVKLYKQLMGDNAKFKLAFEAFQLFLQTEPGSFKVEDVFENMEDCKDVVMNHALQSVAITMKDADFTSRESLKTALHKVFAYHQPLLEIQQKPKTVITTPQEPEKNIQPAVEQIEEIAAEEEVTFSKQEVAKEEIVEVMQTPIRKKMYVNRIPVFQDMRFVDDDELLKGRKFAA